MNLAWNLIDALSTYFFRRGQNIYTGGQPIDTAGGNLNLGAGSLITGGLVDGVDVSGLAASHSSLGSAYSSHIANANAHHAQQHGLDSSDHTGTLSWTKVSKTGSSLADLATRAHSDLSGLTTGDPHSVYFLKTAFSSAPGTSAGVPLKTGAGGILDLGAGLTVDGDTLVVDAANNRVGIKKASPTAVLHVGGNAVSDGSFSAADGVRVGGTGAASPGALLLVDNGTKTGTSGTATFFYDGSNVYVVKGTGSPVLLI